VQTGTAVVTAAALGYISGCRAQKILRPRVTRATNSNVRGPGTTDDPFWGQSQHSNLEEVSLH
jgi:hypothetical protein